eukprot:29082-Pelagococcus_subviridis.AAC.1
MDLRIPLVTAPATLPRNLLVGARREVLHALRRMRPLPYQVFESSIALLASQLEAVKPRRHFTGAPGAASWFLVFRAVCQSCSPRPSALATLPSNPPLGVPFRQLPR